MIEKEQKDLHFILHDSPEPPRLLVVSKRTLKGFTVFLPLLISLILLILLTFAWFHSPSMTKDLRDINLPSLPQLSKEERKIQELQEELQELQVTNQTITQKLSTSGATETELWLGPIKRPYAIQDLTAKKMLQLDELILDTDVNRQTLKFNLVNTGPESQRVTGHIFVLQIHKAGLGIYPQPKAESLIQGIRFDEGESFAVSRLRPVEASFNPIKDSRFVVVIFNREGDLLVKQELEGPFKTTGSN